MQSQMNVEIKIKKNEYKKSYNNTMIVDFNKKIDNNLFIMNI